MTFYLITPLLLIKLWRRGRKSPAYTKRIGERFGIASARSDKPPLWVHAVSVGEVAAIAPVLKQLLARHPELSVLITTSTPTGADRVAALAREYPQIIHQYCPYDQSCAVAKFLSHHQPLGLLIVETELWPNMLAQCSKRNIPVVLANARMSDKSAKGYAKLASLTRAMLNQLDLLIAQYPSDAERFEQLGLSSDKLLISGSIKFDTTVAASVFQRADELKAKLGHRPTLVLASSHPSEEQGVLELLAELLSEIPDLLLIIVPRHPERFDQVSQLAVNFAQKVIRRSEMDSANPELLAACQVYIGDTMGELALLYAVADLAIVGGSFVSVGGQNPIEPALVGKGVLMGPQQYNFSVICPQMEAAQGLITCQSYRELLEQLLALLTSKEQMQQMGVNAQEYVLQQQGATAILLEKIEQLLLKNKVY